MITKSQIAVFFEKHKSTNYIFYKVRNILRQLSDMSFNIGCIKRKKNVDDPQYLPFKEYKNAYEGQRCFIVATGPSLTISDLELLKNETCFSMNSICKILNDTTWKPTFYGIQDTKVYKVLQDEIRDNVKCTLLIGSYIARQFKIKQNFVKYPHNSSYNGCSYMLGKPYTKFSDNCYEVVYDGFTITYSLMQIAVYMGFKEIYLLGVDCNYRNNQKNHFVEVEKDSVSRDAYRNNERMLFAYKVAKQYADAHGIKIINASRGGALDLFPRMDLEDVLGYVD